MLIKSNGELAIKPDEANITIYLECIDKNIGNSKACLVQKSGELNKLVLGHGVKQDDILTTSIEQTKEYNWENNSNEFIGYKSAITTQLHIRDLKVLERLYTELLTNENIRVGNLTYMHSKIDSLNNVAYQKALENANILADQLLVKMNESGKEILRVGNMDLPAASDDYEVKSDYKAKALEANVSKDNVGISNGTMYINKGLVVEYRIK